MNEFRPTKKILFTTAFMLAVVFVSEIIISKVDVARNNAVYSSLAKSSPEKMDGNVKALEAATQELGAEHKAEIKVIYYQFLAIKWFILVVFSYIASCLLFKRLRQIEFT